MSKKNKKDEVGIELTSDEIRDLITKIMKKYYSRIMLVTSLDDCLNQIHVKQMAYEKKEKRKRKNIS
jgi:hypothetical protein